MKKIIFLSILINIALILPMFILAHQESSTSLDGGHGMMGQMGTIGGWGFWSWLGWIFPISIWVLIVVAIISLIRWIIKK